MQLHSLDLTQPTANCCHARSLPESWAARITALLPMEFRYMAGRAP